MKIKFLSLFLVISVFALETNAKAQGNNPSETGTSAGSYGAPASTGNSGGTPAVPLESGAPTAEAGEDAGVFGAPAGAPAGVTAPTESSGTNN